MDILKHIEINSSGYPPPCFPARHDFEAWCWHHRGTNGETGEAARFVLGDMLRGCWTPTRKLDRFQQAHHGHGAIGRENVFIEHLVSNHGAGLDSPLIRMARNAHRLYLEDLRTFWWAAEHSWPGPAPTLDAILDFSKR